MGVRGEWLLSKLCQGSSRAGLLVSSEKGSVALIMNSIIEYIAFVPFCRKVTFCNHAMYVIKLFIKVNILHNKRFLNNCVYNYLSSNALTRLNFGEINVLLGTWEKQTYLSP